MSGPGGSLSPEFLTELFRSPLEPGYAEAAARRRAGVSPPGRQRGLLRALTLFTLIAVGFLFAVAYQQVLADEPERAKVRAGLIERIHEREAETAALRDQADQLRDDVTTLRDIVLTDPQIRQLRELEATTGLARVSGRGVVVRVEDGPSEVDPGTGELITDPEARILDQDLQRIANALWAAGAEAVAINEQRLTVTSTIRNASGAILVDYLPVGSPYEVRAIGPADLADRFSDSETADLMQLLTNRYGISYDLRSEREVELPAATTPRLYHARTPGATPSPSER